MTDTSRPVLVLLRGLIRSRFHWNGFAQRFSDDYQVIEPELPGNGFLYNEITPTGIAAMMQSVRNQVKREHAGPVTLIAISMGGMIATEWARQFPQEIHAMHLINTSLANLSKPWERMNAQAFFRLLFSIGSINRLENTIYSMTINHDVSKEDVAKWKRFANDHPLQWRNVYTQLLAASSYKGPLSAPIENVFFYNSIQDRLVRPNCSKRIAEQWRKPLLSHPTAGHDLSADDPDWLENSIRKHL